MREPSSLEGGREGSGNHGRCPPCTPHPAFAAEPTGSRPAVFLWEGALQMTGQQLPHLPARHVPTWRGQATGAGTELHQGWATQPCPPPARGRAVPPGQPPPHRNQGQTLHRALVTSGGLACWEITGARPPRGGEGRLLPGEVKGPTARPARQGSPRQAPHPTSRAQGVCGGDQAGDVRGAGRGWPRAGAAPAGGSGARGLTVRTAHQGTRWGPQPKARGQGASSPEPPMPSGQ